MYSYPSSDIRFPIDPLSIPPAINQKLASAGFRFIKIRPVSKQAHETGWNKTNNYLADDPSLLLWLKHPHSFEIRDKHFEGFGNYGVLCDDSHIVVDLDSPEILQAYIENQQSDDPLPKTFTVQSGSGHGMHFIYTTSGAHTIKLDHPETKMNVGHVKSTGGYAVGPSSIHEKTHQPYIVLEDRDVAFVEFDTILRVFEKYILKKEVPPVAVERLERAKYERLAIDIPIASIAMPEKPVVRGGGEIQGAHPIHGSKSGMNFSINTVKNTFFCHRCGGGGSALEWLAIEKDIIRCDEAHKGCLRGDKFREVLDYAKLLGYAVEIPRHKVVEKPRILTQEPILLDELPEEIPDTHITLIDAFPRLGKTHWAVLQAIKHRTANIVSNTHSINEQQIRIFKEHRRIGQFAVHLEGKRRSCRNSKNPCQCKHGCNIYPFGKEDGDYMRFDGRARDVLYEKEILTNADVPEGMCPYWTIKSAEKVAHFCFTVSANLSMISERSLIIIDEDPTISYFYPSSVDLAENSLSEYASQAKCQLGDAWEGVERWKKYLTEGRKHPEGKKTILRIIEVLEQIREVLLINKDESENFNKTRVIQELNKIDTFIPEPEDITKVEIIEKIKKYEMPDTLSIFAEPLLFPYVKQQFMWQGHHPAVLRMIANEELRIRDPPENKMVIIGSTRAEMFAKSTGKETSVIRVKTFPFSENFLFIVVKPGEKETYTNKLEHILKDASKVNEMFRYPSLVLVGTDRQQGRLSKVLGGIAKGSKEENRVGQQWNRKSGQMNIFYQNSVISRGIDVEFYTRLFVHTTSFANPYWMAVAEVADREDDAELANKALGILDAIMMDETTNSVLRISPVRRNPQTVTKVEQFEDKIPKVVIINEEELWKVKPGVLESVNMVTTTFDILRDNLMDVLDQTGSLHLNGLDLITVDLPHVKPEMSAKEKAQALVTLLTTAPFDTSWKNNYMKPFLEAVENALIEEITAKKEKGIRASVLSILQSLEKRSQNYNMDLVQRVITDMIRKGKLREYRSDKISVLEVRPLACNITETVKYSWQSDEFEI